MIKHADNHRQNRNSTFLEMKTEETIIKELKTKWDINPFQFLVPPSEKKEANICYFDSTEFINKFGFEKLNRIYNDLKKGKVYQFTQPKETKIMDVLRLVDRSENDTFFVDESISFWVYYTP